MCAVSIDWNYRFEWQTFFLYTIYRIKCRRESKCILTINVYVCAYVRLCICVCLCCLRDASAFSRTELGKSKIIVSRGFASKGKCRRTTRTKLKFDIIFYYRPNVLLNSYGLADIKTPFTPVHDYILHASTAALRSVEHFIYYTRSQRGLSR